MTKKKVVCLSILSLYSLIFGLIAIFGYDGGEYTYLPQRNTFSCSRPGHAIGIAHNHDFEHQQTDSTDAWLKAGLDFDPLQCDPFYMRAEVADQIGDFADMQFFWFSRIDNVMPQMWQIYIEAVVSPHIVQFSTQEEITLEFDLGLAIRGKNSNSESWDTIYSDFHDFEEDAASKVTVSCPVEIETDDIVCDSFELGIIGHLDYQMYDIAIMISNTPSELLAQDLATVSFRLSHLNDSFLTWFATVRLLCLLVTSCITILYFVSSCTWKGFRVTAWLSFNIDQFWVLSLLLCCAVYNEPLFEMRRTHPSVALAVLSEIPSSLFYTGLLNYWLLGITYIRVKAKHLREKRETKATLSDIIGVLSLKRLFVLLLIGACFIIAQTFLHLAYLTTETNRSVFSSFGHFKTSEDLESDPTTVVLIVINALFGVLYITLFIIEAIRSFLDFQRLQFSKKVGQVISLIMVILTLCVLLAKFSRKGGFSTQLTLTVIYNAYMWHLAYLHLPSYSKAEGKSDRRQAKRGKAQQAQAQQQSVQVENLDRSEMFNIMDSRYASQNRTSQLVPTTQMNLNNPNDVSEIQLDAMEGQNSDGMELQGAVRI